MLSRLYPLLVALLLLALAGTVRVGLPTFASAHEGHASFAAGEPGDPKKPAREVRVVMFDDGSEAVMSFDPATITVRRGEQVRFRLQNTGTESHEFVLATVAENRKHAELMKKFPDMEHDDPNARRVAMSQQGELLWKFTKAGEFEYACLIPGHYEAGMHGKIIVR
jgi:uncharacterized cupredoxin-like copper-binding protein